MKQFSRFGVAALLIAVFGFGTSFAYAQEGSSSNSGRNEHSIRPQEANREIESSESPSASPSSSASSSAKGNRSDERSNKSGLTRGQQRACQVREMNIKKRSEAMTKRADKMVAKFDTITSRVQEFYVSKGLTVANYDQLVADIAAKKVVVATALAAAKADLAEFSCDASDPKAIMSSYRDNMKAVNKALKEYRTSIKNLIKAVKQAAGGDDESEATASPSASPSASASASPSASPSED